jgi:hypothetical protein
MKKLLIYFTGSVLSALSLFKDHLTSGVKSSHSVLLSHKHLYLVVKKSGNKEAYKVLL